MLFAGLKKRLVAATFLSSVAAISVEGASLQLAWNPSTSPDVVEYRVYVGSASGQYSSSYSAGNVTSYSVTNLVAGSTYHFAVTAVNRAGLESDFSTDVSGQAGAVTSGATLTGALLSTGSFELQAQGTPSASYVIERSDNLAQWTTVTTRVANSQGLITYRPGNISQPRRFFRVRQQ